MKKRFLVITAMLFICSIFIWNVPAQAKTKNFLMDKSKVYTISYYHYEGKKKKTEKSVFHYKKQYKRWIATTGGELWEKQNKTYYSWGGGYGGKDEIKRNAKVGDKVYGYGSASKWYFGKVTSIKATVKTKAGTFKNCTVVQNKKLKQYYAPNNGLVLSIDSKGKIEREVTKISKK